MKLTREEARQMDIMKRTPFYKTKLQKYGEATLYLILRKEYKNGKIGNISIVDYVEKLKSEIEQEKMLENSKVKM